MIYRLPSNMRKSSKSLIVREIKATEIILHHHLWWLKWKRKEHILTIMWIKWNSFALLEGSKMIHPLRSHIRFPSKWEKITTRYNKTPEDILKERKERKSQGICKDGGGIGWEDHFLPHKFLKRTFQRWANSTKQIL